MFTAQVFLLVGSLIHCPHFPSFLSSLFFLFPFCSVLLLVVSTFSFFSFSLLALVPPPSTCPCFLPLFFCPFSLFFFFSPVSSLLFFPFSLTYFKSRFHFSTFPFSCIAFNKLTKYTSSPAFLRWVLSLTFILLKVYVLRK